MQEWLNWPAWKASKHQKCFRGSNPLLSAGRPESAGHHAKPRRIFRRGFVALLSSPSLPRPSHQGNRTRQKKSLPCFRGGTSQKNAGRLFLSLGSGSSLLGGSLLASRRIALLTSGRIAGSSRSGSLHSRRLGSFTLGLLRIRIAAAAYHGSGRKNHDESKDLLHIIKGFKNGPNINNGKTKTKFFLFYLARSLIDSSSLFTKAFGKVAETRSLRMIASSVVRQFPTDTLK